MLQSLIYWFQPEHEYIDYISKNLGKNWHSIFRALGFTQGRIETVEIDEARNGVSEVTIIKTLQI